MSVTVGDIIRNDEQGASHFGCVVAVDSESCRVQIDWFTDYAKACYGDFLSFWAYGYNWHKVRYVPSSG
jgi:hypothetical protein